MGLFADRGKTNDGKTQVPVWFMRQAGRYHAHYQNIKKDSNFIEMCKNPSLAVEITMGPINEFDFDAAILFSDLLFPLEQLGMGLTYAPGPKLNYKLQTQDDIKKLKVIENPASFYRFQHDACLGLKKELPQSKTLLGFVGAPFTLYTYAVEGSHSGNLTSSKLGLRDGRWNAFTEILFENLLSEMKVQAEGGADAICIFDTAVGELNLKDFKTYSLPALKKLTKEFKKVYPDKKIVYYSKHTHSHYLNSIEDDNIDVLGVDWRCDLGKTINELGDDYIIQGNFDPSLLHLPWNQLESELTSFWEEIQNSGADLSRWIMGLGHGVLQHTPESNVKKSIEFIHSNFNY